MGDKQCFKHIRSLLPSKLAPLPTLFLLFVITLDIHRRRVSNGELGGALALCAKSKLARILKSICRRTTMAKQQRQQRQKAAGVGCIVPASDASQRGGRQVPNPRTEQPHGGCAERRWLVGG